MGSLIEKRFHISGLTPTLTRTDVFRRLSSFGVVKALDGFGVLNELNEPRKFAYVTLEGTASNLSRCLNVLSGSTWKGAKIRISEAKLDFRESLILERKADPKPPRKKHRRAQAVEAADMSLVTPENVGKRGGWKVTALGRIIRPIKMRPSKPLMWSRRINGNTYVKSRNLSEKNKARKARKVLTRMRRRTIDPTTWGSVHLKGAFLDAERMPRSKSQDTDDPNARIREALSEDDSKPTSAIDEGRVIRDVSSTDYDTDISREKDRSMAILQSLFGPSGENMSEVDEDQREGLEENKMKMVVDDNGEGNHVNDGETTSQGPRNSQQKKQLRDLFAPREEQGNFSIIGHLGLDLELDDDILVSEHPTLLAPVPEEVKPGRVSMHGPVDVDLKQPLFFPASTTSKHRVKDVYDTARERGWNWQDPAVGFWRTESENEIRRKWDIDKVELTKSWKKRWREAGKTRRRVDGGEDTFMVERV